MSLPAQPSQPLVVTDDNSFDQLVIDASTRVPVVVHFWADWCQPCRKLSSLLMAESQSRPKVRFCAINIDDGPLTAHKYQVSALPVVFGFVNGAMVDHFHGVISRSDLTAWLDRLISLTPPSRQL